MKTHQKQNQQVSLLCVPISFTKSQLLGWGKGDSRIREAVDKRVQSFSYIGQGFSGYRIVTIINNNALYISELLKEWVFKVFTTKK